MLSVAKLKGTTAGSFTIGTKGATLYQGTSTTSVSNPVSGDLFILVGSTPSVLQYNGTTWYTLAISPTWATIASAGTTKSHTNYFVDTSAAPFTVTLPASPSMGDRIVFLDATGSFGTNAFTIDPNGNTIMSQTGKKLQLNSANQGVELVFFNAMYGWRILDTSSFSQTYV